MSLFDLVPSFVRPQAVTTASPSPSSASAGSGRNTPTQRPHYQIDENADAWQLTVVLPGVTKAGLELTVEDGEVRLFANRAWKQPEDWTPRYRETRDLPYELSLSHENAINLDAVAATLSDGILTVTLPKAEARKPRKITVG